MGNSSFIFSATSVLISAPSVIFCLLRSREVSHKKLPRSAFLLGAMVMICFGGKAILSHFDMGWRCTPFNIMLFLCAILFIITLWRCLDVLSLLKNTNSVLIVCGFISLVLVIMITLARTAVYFPILSWHDKLSPHNGQMIVCANDMHGGSGNWRYYTHINDLIHGAEIAHDGLWWGTPSLQS